MPRKNELLAYTDLSSLEKRLAVGVAFLMIAVTCAIAPFARTQSVEMRGFLPMVCAVVIICEAFTAIILYKWFRVTRHAPTAVLSIAYAVSAIYALLYIVTFPDVFAATGLLGAGTQTSPWVYVCSRAYFLMLVIVFAGWEASSKPHDFTSQRLKLRLLVAAVTVLSVGTLLLITAGYEHLPVILSGMSYTATWRYLIAPVVLALNVAALLTIVIKTKLRRSVHLWVAVVTLGFMCDFLVSGVLSGGRFTLGWYFSRVQWLFASVAFMGALISNLNRILIKLTSRNERLFDESITDELTGLLNKRGYNERLDAAFSAAQRSSRPLALLLLDVDHFKNYNDSYGHVEGDAALAKVAKVVRLYCQRGSDVAARVGGEELAVILPDSGESGALALGERLRRGIEILGLPQGHGEAYDVVTVSVGVISTENCAIADTETLRCRCDAALYQAKRTGRNRVVLAPNDEKLAFTLLTSA